MSHFLKYQKKYIYELVSQKYGNPSIDFVKTVSYGDYFIGKVLFNDHAMHILSNYCRFLQ